MEGGKMETLIIMSQKEIKRLEVMHKLEEKRITQKKAAEMLEVSIRQVKRIWKAYQQEGSRGVITKKRGKPSGNQLDPLLRQKALDWIYRRYIDFGPTLATEKLCEEHGLKISRESVRKLMISEGLWKPGRIKKMVIHPLRERRACCGELIQIDGSDHDWFEGRGPRCTLLVFIDDATGQLMELYFTKSECFFSYCQAIRHYIARFGKPAALYSDKHSIFRVNIPNAGKTDDLTQFGRAMQQLGIPIICANTPQAKGRVEKAIRTLQNRLVKELRLHKISSIDQANSFVNQFRQSYNQRFAVIPRSSINAHRPILDSDNLDHILTWQETRTLSKNLTLQFNKVVYQIKPPHSAYALRKTKVLVCENAEGQITIYRNNSPLLFSVFHQQVHQSLIVTSKSLNRNWSPASTPAHDHPWRSYGYKINGKSLPQPS
ncbi:MAG: ISNCY family transposase [Chloroflexi bacterium]|nr:ISNCY family transposase [Chloroflexota bacterium]